MAQYRALYDYLPDTEAYSYMALRVNNFIDKVKDVGNGWLMGFNTNTGDFGIFPASYAEKIEKLSVKSDIAGRLLLLPDNPTAPPSQKVREEIRRMKEAVSNDQMVNEETRTTIKIEPTPATESEDCTIEKIDMTALKAEINRQLMLKRNTEEEPSEVIQELDDTDMPSRPSISSPKLIDSTLKPHISDPKPEITHPKPLISGPKPLISSPKPVISSPKPVISLPKPVISTPKPLISTPKLVSSSKPVESLPNISSQKPKPSPKLKHEKPPGLSLPPKVEKAEPSEDLPLPNPPSPVHNKLVIGNPVPLEPLTDNYPVPLQPIGKQPSEDLPLPNPPSPVHNKLVIGNPVPLEPLTDNYPVPLQPIGNHDNYHPPPIIPPVNVPVPSSPVHLPSHTIQPSSHPTISAPILQDSIGDSYPVPLRPIGQPIAKSPPPKPKVPQPIIPVPVVETQAVHVQDPSKPIISEPIPIQDPNKPVISAPIPIPLTGHQPPNLPTQEDPVLDIPLETDKDTKTLVSDEKAKADKKPKKEKKVKPVKEKKVKEKKMKKKKPPRDLRVSLYSCIANCSAKTHMKTVLLGILGGLISGGIVFVLLAFSFNYDLDIAGWIALGITLVFSFFLALSATFRCLVLLMLPTLVTGRGRAAILAFIFAILLTGPVLNISSNAQEVSGSMACTTELIANQTKALKHQLVEPLIKIAQRINDSFQAVKDLADSFLTVIDPIINTIEQFQSAAQKAFDKLQELSVQCKSFITGAHTTCVSAINSAKTSCEDFFNSIDPTDDIVNGIEDLGKSLGIGKRRKRAAHDKSSKQMLSRKGKLMQILQSEGMLPSNAKLMQLLQSETMLPSNAKLMQLLQSQVEQSCENANSKNLTRQCIGGLVNRSRRGLLENVCVVLDISGLCGALNIAGPVCGVLDTFANLANDSVQEVKNLLDRITNFFVFGLNTTFDISGDINSSQTGEQIINNVKADISSKTTVVLYYAKIIGQVLACSLIFLLLRSFLYLSKWRAKESYDNIYITKEFVRYDAKRKKSGKEHILPLESREKRKYIVTNSILMAPAELQTCQKGFTVIVRSLGIATMIFLIDYALYYILVLIETYGNININVSGTSTIMLNVEGNSIMAMVLRQLSSAVAIDYNYNIDFNMTVCLPHPNAPDTRNIYLIVFLYLMAFVFMFMQAYGLRIRRKVAAHFYPEVEFDRIQYLHSKIRIKRRTIIGWLAHLLTSRKKEKDVSERMTFGSWCYYTFPFLASLCDCKPAKTICLNCDRESDGLLTFHICQTKKCDAVYCSPCFDEMDRRCQICQKKYNF